MVFISFVSDTWFVHELQDWSGTEPKLISIESHSDDFEALSSALSTVSGLGVDIDGDDTFKRARFDGLVSSLSLFRFLGVIALDLLSTSSLVRSI